MMPTEAALSSSSFIFDLGNADIRLVGMLLVVRMSKCSERLQARDDLCFSSSQPAHAAMISTAARLHGLQRFASPRRPTLSLNANSRTGLLRTNAARTLFTRKTPAQKLKSRLWTGAGIVLGGLFAVYAYDSSAGIHRYVKRYLSTSMAVRYILSSIRHIDG